MAAVPTRSGITLLDGWNRAVPNVCGIVTAIIDHWSLRQSLPANGTERATARSRSGLDHDCLRVELGSELFATGGSPFTGCDRTKHDVLLFASERRAFDPADRPTVESFPPGHCWTPSGRLVRIADAVPVRLRPARRAAERHVWDDARAKAVRPAVVAARCRMMSNAGIGERGCRSSTGT
jgi:hypothetical protein